MVEWREAMAPELKPAGAAGASGTTGNTTGGTGTPGGTSASGASASSAGASGASGCYSILLLTAGQYLQHCHLRLFTRGYLNQKLNL